MAQYNHHNTKYDFKKGDFILIVRKRPYFWQSKIHSFGIYNDGITSIKKGKLHTKELPVSEKLNILVQELPPNREELARIHLDIAWKDTLELANNVHGTKHTFPMEFFTVYQIPRDGNLEFYV